MTIILPPVTPDAGEMNAPRDADYLCRPMAGPFNRDSRRSTFLPSISPSLMILRLLLLLLLFPVSLALVAGCECPGRGRIIASDPIEGYEETGENIVTVATAGECIDGTRMMIYVDGQRLWRSDTGRLPISFRIDDAQHRVDLWVSPAPGAVAPRLPSEVSGLMQLTRDTTILLPCP